MTQPTTPAAPDRDAATSLTYDGTAIRQRGPMLNLTDMWRAAGGLAYRRPTLWLDMEETKRFRAYARGRWSHPGLTAEPPETTDPNVTASDIWTADNDGLVATARGHKGGTWAHWQLALAYAQYLSPEFHTWCNGVVRNAMERFGGPPRRSDAVTRYLEQQFGWLHRRLDTMDRHAADIMFLVVSTQELMLGTRRPFSEHSKALIRAVIASPPYEGHCPCCGAVPVLTAKRRPVEGAEFDHAFHPGLNRPEHGWLVCKPCHHELTHGGYLVRFQRMPEFRRFQDALREATHAKKAQRPSATALP